MVIYRHISGITGTFYKRYRPTGLSYYYIEWFCDVFGHNNEYSHTYAGKRHYYCKRCGTHTGISLTWQERIVLEQTEVRENEKR